MTLLKRTATFIVFFVPCFIVVYFAICIVGGAISGGIAGAGHTDPQAGYDAGRQAGASFVRNNMRAILIGSFLVSAGTSAAISFSGVLPWCRKPPQPPPL
jgi:hypothetical protein